MRALHILELRLRTLLQTRRVDQELDEELQYHLDRQIQVNLEGGMAPREARSAALRSIGFPTQIQEQCRDQRGAAPLTGLARDLRYGLRGFTREPLFVLCIVLTLGLAIGANTTVFSVANALLLQSLPVPEPGRLFQVLQPDGPGLQQYGDLFAASDFEPMRDRVAPFAQLAAETEVAPAAASIEGAPPETLSHAIVSTNYFSVLGAGAAIGRTISTNSGDLPAAVLSYAFWQRRFAGNPQVIGRAIRIGQTIFQVIGAAQPGFFGAEAGTTTDLWTPLAAELRRPRTRTLRLFGRLQPGATTAQATGLLQALLHQRMVEMTGRAPAGTPQAMLDRILQLKIKLTPAQKGISPYRAGAAGPLPVLFGLVALVLLVACTTVATLFEARRAMRQREMAVRMSMGASRWRLLRQLLCEAMLIAAAAAAMGLILVHWMRPVLLSLLTPSAAPLQLPPDPSARVLAFTALVSILTALLFGLAPAWRASAVNPIVTLKGGSGASGSALAGRLITGFQVAISLALVLVASLFVRTLVNLYTLNPGFDRHNIAVADLQFQGPEREQQLFLAWNELRRRAASIPGIESASLASGDPFHGAFGNGLLRLPGVPVDANSAGFVSFLASTDFFKTTGIALLQGRDFEPRDFDPAAPPVAVINQSLSRALFHGAALGKTFSNFEDSPPRWVTVIGVAQDTRFESLRNLPPGMVYLPFTWPHPAAALSLVLRVHSGSGAWGAALRQEAAAANPGFALRRIATQTNLIDDTLVRERLLARVAGFFGLLALLMAMTGLYGITSYTVAQRTPEIGVRMALGAARGAVLRMILRESALVVSFGAALGLAGAFAAERPIGALLFGASAIDSIAIATTLGFVLLVTLVAALIPARRASKTDPVVALRYE